MSQGSKGKVVVIGRSDVSLKISDIVEQIISGILEAGEVDVVGVGDGMFLACSAMNMATEISNVYVDDICIDNLVGTCTRQNSCPRRASYAKANLGLRQAG